MFSTSLGSQTVFADSIKFNKPYWLGIKVGNEAELTPHIELNASGYSLTSNLALNVVDGKVIKNLNGLMDNVTLEGGGGTTINTSGNKIIISSSGTGGTGIQGVQNTNNTLDITNSNGPTATMNIKVPLTLSGSRDNSTTFTSINTGTAGIGIRGESSSGTGVLGKSSNWSGTYGETGTWFGVWGKATGENGKGVLGESATSFGVWGVSPNSAGVVGESDNWVGVYGETEAGNGVWGKSMSAIGVYGESALGTGIYGTAQGYRKYSVFGKSSHGNADAFTYGALGYLGDEFTGDDRSIGVIGVAENDGIAVAGYSNSPNSTAGYFNSKNGTAGYFDGIVIMTDYLSVKEVIANKLSVTGTKNFKIDHPLDPANKYLIHSCVESSERINIYSGNITTDGNGFSLVELPGYFQALNIDYRYQLTAIGQKAQSWIETEINNNQFTIKTDKPNVKVSWQVTGIRNDEYAKQNPMVVEEGKETAEKGKYLMPELFRKPKEMGIHYVKTEEPKINKQQLPVQKLLEKDKANNNGNK